MARSETSICNMALAMLGNDGTTISSLNENSKPARLCKTFYTELRDTVLCAHPWNFATKRSHLAQLSDTPEFEFAYAYGLPDDFLKIVRTDVESVGMEDDFRIENIGGVKCLLSDEGEVEIEYIATVSDPNLFDPIFTQALATRIAASVAPGMTDNSNMAVNLMKTYTEIIREARAVDAQQGKPRGIDADTWTNARI